MRTWTALFAFALWACGNPPPESGSRPNPTATAEVVKPPFVVAGEAEGLLLVWYDAAGKPQPATKRSDIPEAQRARVRVDSLEIAPDKRLDPGFVYVADLQKPGPDGHYLVRKMEREAFEASVMPAKPEPLLGQTAGDVIIYGASWCGACKSAAKYFTQKGVPFVEKDIEKEPDARSEMLAKAQAQGVNASGIPVIDVKGTLLGGFDPRAVDRALAQ
jgi:glutaredoxin